MKSLNPSKFLEPIGISKVDKYVKMCYNAMDQLINHKYLIGSDSEENYIYERNLLISLAYFVGRNDRSKIGNCYLFGGEVNKHIFSHHFDNSEMETDISWINYTKQELNFTTNYVSPDFLIHRYKKIDNIERGGQELIVEAKSKQNVNVEEFNRDLFKQNVYLTRLHFKHALCIFVNSTKDDIESRIGEYIRKGYYWSKDYYGKLLFLIQKDEDSHPKLYRVRNELNELSWKYFSCKQ